MKKEVLFVLLNEYADWEGAFLAPALNAGVQPERPVKYMVKTLSVTKDPVCSIGGMVTFPDYDLTDMPSDYAGLVLIGGMQWQSPEAELLVAVVHEAVRRGIPVGGICNASVFLGVHGFLNEVHHTSNTLPLLKQRAGANYTGDRLYIHAQAVSEGNIITANGTGYLEFTREMLLALQADTPEKIEESYQFNKTGLCGLNPL